MLHPVHQGTTEPALRSYCDRHGSEGCDHACTSVFPRPAPRPDPESKAASAYRGPEPAMGHHQWIGVGQTETAVKPAQQRGNGRDDPTADDKELAFADRLLP